ncbi:PREDICTED: uncharacterized protein LOC106628263 [Pseudopodoces humilis]|uniref:uncharacterized protein LOC106628263 n=1 Tax=Pseudopodoces humilis TaxID=181119 RepID=UPI0006B7A1F4|nr:PREDICTED: uncharacterized protein LOC106628263 [Pseudopodoces humilis]
MGQSWQSIFHRVLSCAVLLLLLVAVLSRGRRCSIAKILRQYRAVIFHEIQNLRNLTGSVYRSGRAGPACRWDKDQKILLSIYNISMSLPEVGAGTLQGAEELAVWRVARNTNFVFQENCRKISKIVARRAGMPVPGHASREAGCAQAQLRVCSRPAPSSLAPLLGAAGCSAGACILILILAGNGWEMLESGCSAVPDRKKFAASGLCLRVGVTAGSVGAQGQR